MATSSVLGAPAGPACAGLRRSASSSSTACSGSHLGLGLVQRVRAPSGTLRRVASAAALPAPCACSSAASCSGTVISTAGCISGHSVPTGASRGALSSRRGSAGACLPRARSFGALPAAGLPARAARRTITCAAAFGGGENMDSWDEDEFRRALAAGGSTAPGGAVSPPSVPEPAPRAPPPSPASTSAAMLPVFEWDLPDIPELPTAGPPGSSGRPMGRPAPWDRPARRPHAPGLAAPETPYRGPPFPTSATAPQPQPGPRVISAQQQQQPWGHEKKKEAKLSSRNVTSWSENVVPPGVDVMDNLRALTGMSEVFVILFGVGDGGEEGIYSLKSLSGHGVAVDTVIAFESEVDAERYAALLEAVMVWKPSVCSILPVELVQFVVDSGLSCRLQPAGTHIFPPDWCVPMGLTDWERTTRLRKGHYSVLEAEPSEGGALQSVDIEPELALPMPGSLDQIRQRLEDIYSAS